LKTFKGVIMGKVKSIYYFLENNQLNELEIESILSVDDRKEITFKKLNTDEGGNYG
tara:strand:- start:11 stop:178 length:168 start_codon:yes stop_codon:yes gene_type:complete